DCDSEVVDGWWGRRFRLPTRAVDRRKRLSHLLDCLHQFMDAFAFGSNSAEDGAIEALGVEFQFHALRAGTIGLVDHEDIGDLHDSGLDRLHIVTHARDKHHYGYLRDGSNLDFVLPDADRLDDDVIPASRVHQARQIGGRPCNATDGP